MPLPLLPLLLRSRAKPVGPRKTIAPKGLGLIIPDARIASIFLELTKMEADKFPNAGAVLIRVFLELSVDAILKREGISLKFKNGGHTLDKKLKAKVKEAVDALVANGEDAKTFLSITTGVDKSSSPLCMDLLHAYVHNSNVTPKPSELITTWDDAQPFFEAAWQ